MMFTFIDRIINFCVRIKTQAQLTFNTVMVYCLYNILGSLIALGADTMLPEKNACDVNSDKVLVGAAVRGSDRSVTSPTNNIMR